MPMHDWTRVFPGVFHAFHNAWIGELQKKLNSGVLPPSYYALSRERQLAIHHSSDDRMVAVIGIVSSGAKHSRRNLDDLIDRILAALSDGIHVMVIDPFPPGKNDPSGLHGEIWDRLMAGYYSPGEEPLAITSYCAGESVAALVEPLRVGSKLTPMPLFLTPDNYVSVPLEETYSAAWEGFPQRWRRVIEA